MNRSSDIQRILVVIPTANFTQRQLLEGLLEFAHKKKGPSWQLHLDLRNLDHHRLHNLSSWNCSGIIAFILSDRERQDFIKTGLPAVFIDPLVRKPPKGLPRNIVSFVYDFDAEGRTAAEYFLERRYNSFAYVGSVRPQFWSQERERGFIERLARDGIRPALFEMGSTAERDDFAVETKRLTAWLKTLTKPAAVFCATDARAHEVIATALDAGLRVPEDISILGVDNDALICETTVPPMSSIPMNDHIRGREAGKALAALLDGKRPARVRTIEHGSVVTRTSTDTLVLGDAFVTRALTYARTHFAERPGLLKLAEIAGCSKTELNRRARRCLGRTIGEELIRIKLQEAIALLKNTDKTVEEIAISSGFYGASHLGMRLSAAFGRTPSSYRP